MRPWLFSLVLVLMLIGCHGSETALPEPETLQSAFAGLPSPAAIKAMDTSPHSGKQVSFYTDFDGHQWEPALAHSDNVTAVPANLNSTMAGRKTPLTYCIFRVAPNILSDGQPIQDIFVSCWYDEEPVAPEGMYVGFSDFTTNSWYWLGPQFESHTHNVNSIPLTGAVGSEYVVIVNYSDIECTINEIIFQVPSMSAGVDWVYYTAAPAFPGEPRGINRVLVAGTADPEPVKTGIMLDGYRSPEVRYMPGGDRLYYTKEQGATGGIYWSDMTGSGENDHRTYTSLHILDWDLAGDIEFYIDGYGTETPTGWWYNQATSGGYSVTPANGYIVEGIPDIFHEGHDYAMFLGLAQPAPADNSGLYWTGFDTGPFAGSADALADNGTEQVKGLTYSRYLHANGEYVQGCYFVSNDRNPGDTTENIYRYNPDTAAVEPYLVNDLYDFGGIVFGIDGKWCVIAVRDPGDPYYDLHIAPANYVANWPAYGAIAINDYWGDLEWYYQTSL